MVRGGPKGPICLFRALLQGATLEEEALGRSLMAEGAEVLRARHKCVTEMPVCQGQAQGRGEG